MGPCSLLENGKEKETALSSHFVHFCLFPCLSSFPLLHLNLSSFMSVLIDASQASRTDQTYPPCLGGVGKSIESMSPVFLFFSLFSLVERVVLGSSELSSFDLLKSRVKRSKFTSLRRRRITSRVLQIHPI